MISNLKYLKDNIDTFDIVNFFKFLHCSTEDECREGFKTLVVDATYVNKKRYKDLINFAANMKKTISNDECKHYYEELKTQEVLDAYEETAWNREKAAAVKSIDVSKKILQSAKSSQPIPPQQQRSVQPPTQSFQKQQQKQNQTTENQDDRCKKRQKISNDSSNESLEPTESTIRHEIIHLVDANEEMASEIEDDQANDSDEEESTSADDETQISTIIEYHSHSTNEFHSSLSNETDDTYKTEISKIYAEMYKTKKYVLTFHEFNNETSASNGLEYDFNYNLVERLELSNVSLASGTNIQQAEDLDAEEANKVKAWRRCTKQNNYFYPPQANSINECQLHTLLARLNNPKYIY